MGSRAVSRCNCGALVPEGARCRCRTQSTECRLYARQRWKHPVRGLRARQLAREPLCRACKQAGRTRAACHVDHVRPHGGCERLFWAEGNLQSLCSRCHASKTNAERGHDDE